MVDINWRSELVLKILKVRSGTHTTVSMTKTGCNSHLARGHSFLSLPTSMRKHISWGPWSPLRNLRSSKHFNTSDLAVSLCTFSMYNKGRVGESTYFSTKTSGFIRVSCSRKAKGNKTQRNTNKDSHYQPFKYTDHTSVVYTEIKEMYILHISVNQHSHPLRPLINHLVVRQPHRRGVHPSSLLEWLWMSGVVC